ncbi:MAG: biopolymer transport protein ExbD [Rhodothermales bacterium]|jgi:biopolymer transport protein ExbD
MQLRRKSRREVEMDLTAFSDIAFLLIIFFLVATTFIHNNGTPLEIPTGTADKEESQEKITTIDVTPEKILYNGEGKSIDMPELRALLQREGFTTRPDKERMVMIQSASEVECERYYQIVTAISQAGGVLAMLEEEAAPE